MIEFPKFLYHKTLGAKLVKAVEEAEKLGKEWVSSPAEFGVITCPSQDQIDAAKMDKAEKIEEKPKAKAKS